MPPRNATDPFTLRFQHELENLKARGVSQGAFARRYGFSANTVSAWRCGRYKPDLDNLRQLADAFGISVAELAGERTPRSEVPSGESASPAEEASLFQRSSAERLVQQLVDLNLEIPMAAIADLAPAVDAVPSLMDILRQARRHVGPPDV